MKLPFAPLEEFLRRHDGLPLRPAGVHVGIDGYWSTQRCAELLDRDSSAIVKWRRDGVGPRTADRLAVAIRRHPWEIWGDAYYEAEAAIAPECGTASGVGEHRRAHEPLCEECRAYRTNLERRRRYAGQKVAA